MFAATRRHRGFTLIELLVVIAIISILASILFPVFSKARGKGRQAACISNVHQIGLAALQYAQDYDEMMPGRGQPWYDGIFPYTHNRQIYVCPDRKDLPRGYGQNPLTAGVGQGIFWDASSKILFADCFQATYDANVWWVNDPGNDICNAASDSPPPTNRHNDGVIFGFADGHTKWARPDTVDTDIFWNPTTASE